MKRFYLYIFFLPAVLFASWDNLFPSDDPTLFHHVNVMYGHLSIHLEDHQILGAKSLPVVRTYSSSGALHSQREKGKSLHEVMVQKRGWIFQGGWSFFPHANLLYVKEKDKGPIAYVAEPSGSVIKYIFEELKGKHRLFLKPTEKIGQFSGKIGGRTNPENNRLKIHTVKGTAVLYGADGSVRYYRPLNYKDAIGFMLLEKEKLSSGHWIDYTYDEKNLPTKISLVTPDRSKPLSSFLFDHYKKSKPYFRLRTSDQWDIQYKTEKIKGVSSLAYAVKHDSSGSCCRREISSYSEGRPGIGPRLTSLEIGQQKKFEVEYYLPSDDEYALDKVKSVKAPYGSEGEMVTVAHFTYEEGETRVRDAEGLLTIFRYDDSQLLSVEYYNKKDQLYSIMQFIWQERRLVGKALLNPERQAILSKTFRYDDRGNVLEEALWGNLSGTSPGPFPVHDDGTLEGAESLSKEYTYSSDNLLLTEDEEEGPSYTYQYMEGTDLITAKLTHVNGAIYRREFYTYNAHHLLIDEIIDDGSGEDKDDLTGVTRRQIHRRVRESNKCMPVALLELSWDPKANKEVLSKQTAYTYARHNLLDSETVYDAKGIAQYTLYYDRDNAGRIIRKTTPSGMESTYEYDQLGRCITKREAGEFPQHITYNGANLPITCTEITDDGKEKVMQNVYDVKGRLLDVIDYLGNVTSQQYDAFGRSIRTVEPKRLDVNGLRYFPVSIATYDLVGNQTSIENPRGDTTRIAYTTWRKPTLLTSPSGHKTQSIYSKKGQLIQTILPDQTQVTQTYDLFDRPLVKRTYCPKTDIAYEESWSYDAFSCVKYVDPLGNITTYTYNPKGQCIRTDRGKLTTTYEYDTQGNRISTTAHGIKTVQQFDLEGRVTKEWEEDNEGVIENFTAYYYDEKGRKSKAERVTSQATVADHFTYDGEGRLTSHTDPNGAVTRFLYNEAETLDKTTIDPLGNQILVRYDLIGNPTEVRRLDPDGKTVSLEQTRYDQAGYPVYRRIFMYEGTNRARDFVIQRTYSPDGHLIKEVEQDDKVTEYAHDPCGRISTHTRPDKTTLAYTYDGHGRVLTLKSSDQTIDYTYHYDEHQLNPLLIINHQSNTRIFRSYTQQGQIAQETTSFSLTSNWKYDLLGRCIRMTLPDRSSIHYTYSGKHMRRVERLGPDGQLLYCHNYNQFDENGHVIEEQLINKAIQTTTHDLLERPQSQTNPWCTQTITFGPSGLVQSTTSTLSEPKTYTYDPLNQLKTENDQTYAFDSLGNPLKQILVNRHNQIERTPTANFFYDINGNMTKRRTDNTQTSYIYDALGRLTQVTQEDKNLHYEYDPAGRLLAKTIHTPTHSATYNYVYDHQGREIATVNPDGSIIELKVLGLGIRGEVGAAIAIEINNTPYVPLHNFQGHIIALIKGKTLAQTYTYTAFKEEPTPSPLSPWRYSSKRTDPDLALIYFGKRFYDPGLGRWHTPDPAGYIDSPNLYLYVLNSPLNRLDLFGLNSGEFGFSFGGEDPGFYTSPLNESNQRRSVQLYFQPRPIFDTCLLRRNIEGVPVDCILLGGNVRNIKFTPEEIAANRANLFDHFHELIPKQGSQIALVTFVNGICNNFQNFLQSTNFIYQQLSENTLTLGIFHPTQGTLQDLMLAGQELDNQPTQLTRQIQTLFNTISTTLQSTNPDAQWLHISHSRGCADTVRGLEALDYQVPNLHVLGITPALPIPKDLVTSSVNYYSSHEVLRPIGEFHRLKHPNKYNIEIVQTIYGNPMTEALYKSFPAANLRNVPYVPDHAFLSPTYQSVLKKEINEMRKEYGFVSYETR